MQDKITKKVHEIADVIYKKINNQQLPEKSLGLYDGEFGLLLFLFYYSKHFNIPQYSSLTEEYAEQLLNKFSRTLVTHTFCSGLAGVLYLFEFLRQNNFIDIDISDAEQELENYLICKMEEDIVAENYDFLHGAIGVGLVFLKRKKYQNTLSKLIDFLYDTAEKSSDKEYFKWKSIINHPTKTKGYNIALSHGMSSVLIFLSRIIDCGIKDGRVSEMIKGAATIL